MKLLSALLFLPFLASAASFTLPGPVTSQVMVDMSGHIVWPTNFASANNLGGNGGDAALAGLAITSNRLETLNTAALAGLATTSNRVETVNTAKQDHTANLDAWALLATSAKQNALGFVPLNPANNLSELASALTSRANLGLVIGSNVQAWDADLDAIAALATTGYVKRTGPGAFGVDAQISLATGVTGNLPVGNLDGGSGANGTNVWLGTGHWGNSVLGDWNVGANLNVAGATTFNIMNVDTINATNVVFQGLTVSRALILSGSGVAAASATTAAQLGYLSTATSDIQTQLNAKLTSASIIDTPYGPGWNGDANHAPSANAVWDKIEAVVAGSIIDTPYSAGWNGDSAHAPSANVVWDKIESMLLATGSPNTTNYPGVVTPLTPGGGAAAAAAIPSQNVVYVELVTTTSYTPITNISFNVVAANAGAIAAAGVYSFDGTSKLYDTGAVAFGASTGLKKTTLGSPGMLPPGNYAVVFTSNQIVPTYTSIAYTAGALVIANAGNNPRFFTASNNSSAGVLPSTLGTLTANNTAFSMPMISWGN